MKVTVTAKHIEEAEPGDSTSCPVTLAVNDATGGISQVFTDEVWITSRDYSQETIHQLPMAAVLFTDKFHSGMRVRPFIFELGPEM